MLTEQMRREGTFLFRWRSYMPLAVLPLVVFGLSRFHYPGGSYMLDLIWEFSCLGLAMAGLALRALTVGCAPRGTSGRNTRRIKAQGLNTSGMYSVVRHPLYLANFIIFAAVLMNVGPWYVVAIGSLAYWLYYERIMVAEESMLREVHGERFEQWAAATPAVWPRRGNWKSPALPFSFRQALRREYTTFFAIITAFTVVETAGHSIADMRVEIEPLWATIFAVALLAYVTCRLIKKHSRLLHVPGR